MKDRELKQFQETLDQTLLLDAGRKGMSLNDALQILGIPKERYQRWFGDDLMFRCQLYAAVSNTTVEALMASVDDES